jgi:hypothetical protein
VCVCVCFDAVSCGLCWLIVSELEVVQVFNNVLLLEVVRNIGKWKVY